MQLRRRAFMDVVTSDIADPRVIEAFERIRRRDFVPEGSESEADLDRPVVLPHRQTTSQPSLIARMIEAVRVDPEDRVLEIGTGYGFQTALLAVLARHVVSIERHRDLAEQARRNLENAGLTNAEVHVGDGWDGWADGAPYDAIVVSAAAAELPQALAEQLGDGGRLVVPLKRERSDDVVVLAKAPGGEVLEERLITAARFVPLVRGRHDA